MNAEQATVIRRLFHQAPERPSMLLGLRLNQVVGEAPPIARWEAWDAMVAYVLEKEGLEKPGVKLKKSKAKRKPPSGSKCGPKAGRAMCQAKNPVTGRKCKLRIRHVGQHKHWFLQRTNENVPPEMWGDE